MNPVGELLTVENVVLDLDVPDKETLLRRVAAMLARQGRLVEAEVLESLSAREELGSTALGHGVAIPHARMPQCGAAGGVFVRTKFGIAFDAPEGRIDVDSVLEQLSALLPYDQPTKLLDTLVAWGRYAELIDFDEDANAVHLHEASTSDEEDEA